MERPTPGKRPVGRPRKNQPPSSRGQLEAKQVARASRDESEFSSSADDESEVNQKPRRAARPQIPAYDCDEDEEYVEMPQRKAQKPAARSAPAASEQLNRDSGLIQKRRRSQEAQQKSVSKQFALSNETQGCDSPPTKKQRQATRSAPLQEELELLSEDHSDAQLTVKGHRNQPQKAGYSSAQPPQRAAPKAAAKQRQVPKPVFEMTDVEDHVDDEELQKPYREPRGKAIERLTPTKLTDDGVPLASSSISHAPPQESVQKVKVGSKKPGLETDPSEETPNDLKLLVERLCRATERTAAANERTANHMASIEACLRTGSKHSGPKPGQGASGDR